MDICHAVYRMDWTSFRTETKKSMIMMMLRSQRPITFVCYNVITLSLDAFARVSPSQWLSKIFLTNNSVPIISLNVKNYYFS